MPSNNQRLKGYNKEKHLASLHGLVDSIKKRNPNENVYVDEETAEVVWPVKKSSKQDKQKKKVDNINRYFDKRKKDYPWI